MIIYNVTIKVDLATHTEWLNWMRLDHIPAVMATGYFADHRMMRILEHDESDGITYAVQYHAANMQAYFDYIEKEAPRLRQQMDDLFKDHYHAFRTVMRVV